MVESINFKYFIYPVILKLHWCISNNYISFVYRMNENDNLSLYLSSDKIASFLTEYVQAFRTESQKGKNIYFFTSK